MKAANTDDIYQSCLPKSPLTYIPRRFIMSILTSFIFANMYLQRNFIGTVMTGDSGMGNAYGWSNTQQGFVYSSFYWGYVSLQVVGLGRIIAYFGPKRVMGIGTFFLSLLNVLGPTISSINYPLYLISRFFMGMSGCVLIPCTFQLLTHWYPVEERGRNVTFAFNVGNLGTMISFVITPVLMNALGWRSVFYIYGIVGVSYSFIWLYFSTNHPNESLSIHEMEKKYIINDRMEPLIGQVQKSDQLVDETVKPSSTLSCRSLVNIYIIASYICVFCGAWSLYIQWNYSPLYLHSVLGLELTNAAIYQILPTILGFAVSQLGAYIIEQTSGYENSPLTVIVARRILLTLGFLSQAALFTFMGYVNSTDLAIIFYVAGSSLNSLSVPTYYVSVSDLAPYHSGILMSITNGLGGLSAIISPIVSGVLLDAGGCKSDLGDGQTDECLLAWKIIFFITSAILVLCVFMFNILGTTNAIIGKSGELIEKDAFLNSNVKQVSRKENIL